MPECILQHTAIKRTLIARWNARTLQIHAICLHRACIIKRNDGRVIPYFTICYICILMWFLLELYASIGNEVKHFCMKRTTAVFSLYFRTRICLLPPLGYWASCYYLVMCWYNTGLLFLLILYCMYYKMFTPCNVLRCGCPLVGKTTLHVGNSNTTELYFAHSNILHLTPSIDER